MLRCWRVLTVALLCSSTALAGQGGDTCEEAQSAVWGQNAFDTSNATQSSYPAPDEDACPDPFLDWMDSPDRWFVFVPDVDQINLDTCDSSSYDTSLVVYEGNDCTSLSQIACSGDGAGLDGCQTYYSYIENLDVTPGQTYYIRLGGWQGASGSGTLTITPGAGTIPGACCDDDGLCSQGTLADCLDSGGIFAGADTICADVDCMQYTGACCIGSTCHQISEQACTNQAGLYAGDGSLCSDFDCSDFLGACCVFEDCFVGSEADCDALGGFFYGYGVQCDDPDAEDCGPDYGACCVDDECLEDRTETQCAQDDGDWQGADSTCADVDCDDGGGGSDDPGDTCESAFEAVIGNNPFNTSSASVSGYPAPSEAQCSGTYLDWGESKDVWFKWESFGFGIITLDTCQAGSYDTSLAVYQGDDCGQLTQIACNGDGSGMDGCQAYYSFIDDIQVTYGETYWFRLGGWNAASGSGTLHVAFEDTGNLPGACCTSDTECIETVGNACAVVGGVFFPGAECGQIDCANPQDTGACCLVDDCNYLSGPDCDAFGGTFFGIGVGCTNIDCNDPVGACCMDDLCLLGTEASCAADGGEWQGDDSACADVMCGCPGDVTGDGEATADDVLAIIAHWGEIGHNQWDLNGDGEIAVEDLLIVIAWFGVC
ncbi:MAG: dockerin type I domain-containing protein [Phycisphaerales bacterium]|nr:dockerin type I domain-containing protein [Phycisphaerales bacterium]